MRKFALVVLVVLAAVPLAAAQTPPTSATGPGQAYFEFILSRHLENKGDEDGALAALKRAETADPKAAEIKAQLAAFYARQNKATEAVDFAERALTLDPNNTEAHRILGLVFAALADAGMAPPAGKTPAQLRRDAIDHLTKILETPAVATDLGLQVTLGRLHMRLGQAEKAVPILERVVSQSPYSTEPYTLLAEAKTAVGRLDEAAAALAMAAELNPRHYAALGELYERMGKWSEAAEAYSNALGSTRTPNRDMRLRMIGALLNVGSAEAAGQAAAALKELATQTPQDTRVLYLLSNASRQLGDLPAAEDAARKMIAIDPTSVSALYALSQVYFAQHDPKKVVALLDPFSKDAATRAKGNEGDAALALSQLGLAYLQLANPTAAIIAFTAAKGFAPKNPAYDAYLIQAHLSAKQAARAGELAAEALARFPGDTRLIVLRADALVEGGRRAEAVKLLTDARTAAPEDDDLTMKLGSVFEEAGNVDDAEREFRRIIERDPLNAQALNYLGYMLADRGLKLPEAIKLIERALKIDPDNPAYLDSLGWALFKDGKPEEAEAPLRKAADVLVVESVIQDHLGDVLARRGKNDEAVAAWERALKGDGIGVERNAIEKKIKEARSRKR